MFWSKTVRSYSHAVYLRSQLNFVLSRHDLLCVSFSCPTRHPSAVLLLVSWSWRGSS